MRQCLHYYISHEESADNLCTGDNFILSLCARLYFCEEGRPGEAGAPVHHS